MKLIKNLSAITRRTRAFAEEGMRDFGLGFPEQLMLLYLAENGPCRQEDFSRYFKLDKGAIAKTAVKLEDKGYIIRTENKFNRREKIVELEPSAESVFAALSDSYEDWRRLAFKGISPKEQKQFEKIAARISDNLDIM